MLIMAGKQTCDANMNRTYEEQEFMDSYRPLQVRALIGEGV